MKPADLYVFSGTGNTYLAADRVCSVLCAEGAGARLRLMEDCSPERVDIDRTLGLAFPIACFGTYPLVQDFLRRLPDGNGCGVFLLDTLGGNSGNYPGRLREFFVRKRYCLLGASEIMMPDNIFGKGALTEKQKAKIAAGVDAAGDFARVLLAGGGVWPERGVAASVWEFINRRAFASRLMQRMRPKVAVAACTGCGLCARDCPVKNIDMDSGRAVVRTHCQFCLRCRGLCPAGAIRAFFTKPYRAVNWPEVIHVRDS